MFSFTSPKSSALIVILEAPLTSTPSYETSVIVSPSIVLPDAPELTVNPSVVAFVPVPLTWMSGWPSAFGSVVPLITTGRAIAGKAESTSIVYTPFFWSLLGRLKLIRLGFAAVAGVALDSVIAERSVPAAVVSALLVTVKVESICRPSSSSTANRRQRAACRRGPVVERCRTEGTVEAGNAGHGYLLRCWVELGASEGCRRRGGAAACRNSTAPTRRDEVAATGRRASRRSPNPPVNNLYVHSHF